MVLKTPRAQIQVNFNAWVHKTNHAEGRKPINSLSALLSRKPRLPFSSLLQTGPYTGDTPLHRPSLGPGQRKPHDITHTTINRPAILILGMTQVQILTFSTSVEQDKHLNSLSRLQTWHHSP